MSAIVVGYVDKPEGRAALRRAAEEAGRRGFALILVQAVPDSTTTVSASAATLEHDTTVTGTLAAVGIEHTVRNIPAGDDYADGLIAIAEEAAADMIVIGLRRRSPVGKLILGSNAQRILLDAPCPVLAVKAGAPTDMD